MTRTHDEPERITAGWAINVRGGLLPPTHLHLDIDGLPSFFSTEVKAEHHAKRLREDFPDHTYAVVPLEWEVPE